MTPPATLPRSTAVHASMTAAVIQGARAIYMAESAIPEPSPGQVRVRLEGCGICGSNIPVWEGRDWFDYPLLPGAPGHEGWGTVDSVGENVADIAPGDRVACLTWNAFAPYDIAEASHVVRLPPSLSELPFPGEPLACAVNAFRRSQVRPRETVVVIGVGFLGALLVQLAKRHGAFVVAVSRRKFARDLAEACGADASVAFDQQAAEAVRSATGADGADCVIEATGRQSALDLATEIVRVRGRVVVAGYHQDGPRQVNMQQWNWKGLDVVNAHERNPDVYMEGMRNAIDEVHCGRIRLAPLLTHVFEFADIAEGFQTAVQRPEGFLKSLVIFPQN